MHLREKLTFSKKQTKTYNAVVGQKVKYHYCSFSGLSFLCPWLQQLLYVWRLQIFA